MDKFLKKTQTAQKTARSQQGQMVLMGAFLIAVITLILLLLTQRILNKTLQQTAHVQQEKRRSVLSAVVDHAQRELSQRLISAQGCNILQTLLCVTCTDWKAGAPKIFPKGLFQLDLLDQNGNPTGDFEAPETDPKAWITATPNVNEFKLNVETHICPKKVGGRVKFTSAANFGPGSEWGYGINWATPCPTAHKKVTYIGVIDQTNWGGIYTLYIDRGFYSNVSVEEPSENSSYDTEELSTAASNNLPLMEAVGGVDVRHTGATYDGQNGCGAASRTVSAYLQMIDSIKASDPCARIAMYSVGGVSSGSPWGSAPNPPHKISPIVADPGNQNLALFRYLQTDEINIKNSLKNLCQNLIPGGEMDFNEVFLHYTSHHQPNLLTVPFKDRNRDRALVIVSEASGPGALETFQETSNDIDDMVRANIYYQSPNGNCNGQGFVSLTNGKGPLHDFDTKTILNGNAVYTVVAANPVTNLPPPSLSPPISPKIPSDHILVQSVRRSDSGTCEPIITTGPDSYDGQEYPYLIPVAPAGKNFGVSYLTTYDSYLANYTPVAKKVGDINQTIKNPALGVREYQNLLILFPIPMVDLDETDSLNLGFSKRSFDIGKIKQFDVDSLLSSYANLFQFIETDRFNRGAKVIGLEN